jgi:hypothetical protein
MVMYASFTFLVHVPLLLSDPQKHCFWTANDLNLVHTGAAWVIADSCEGRHQEKVIVRNA